jgi:hypothetical protein
MGLTLPVLENVHLRVDESEGRLDAETVGESKLGDEPIAGNRGSECGPSLALVVFDEYDIIRPAGPNSDEAGSLI